MIIEKENQFPIKNHNIKAILGPTNTGKTYFAIDRMLSYSSGIICFPLRLLARENYDRIKKKVDVDKVAMITGEEKIIPSKASYYCCTIEAFPKNIIADFICIDEIQLAADKDRGHIFTDRILNSRGLKETLFLGAETIAPKLKQLISEVKIETRPRLSRLSYSGRKKITRLARRTAIVAFSALEVYSIADIIRKKLGGTAIIMGALSPRARNAQVEMYENGEVDFMVSTDAIGMGLNLKINHISFASLKKFDGLINRNLTDPELAQIAGRAGRFLNDGTFGITEHSSEMSPKSIEAIETSNFESLDILFWRNSKLDFSSIKDLSFSLDLNPPHSFLIKKTDAEDHKHFIELAKLDLIKQMATSRKSVELLWEVSQVPEFSKSFTNQHIKLLTKIFQSIVEDGEINNEFISEQINRLDKTSGEIDTLMQRISLIRTWTYLSHKRSWMPGAEHWQKLTLAIEDKLSDALNNSLRNRFVDKRLSIIGRKKKEIIELTTQIKSDGYLYIDEMKVGRLRGFVLELLDSQDPTTPLFEKSIVKSLSSEINDIVRRFYSVTDESLTLNDQGQLYWDASLIAKLVKGNNIFSPEIHIFHSDLLDSENIQLVSERIQKFIESSIKKSLGSLISLKEENLNTSAKGIVFQLKEGLGSIPLSNIEKLIKSLSDEEKKDLGRNGIRFGVEYVYMPDLLKPAAVKLRALLYGLNCNEFHPDSLPDNGRVAYKPKTLLSDQWYNKIGYAILGDRVMRVDMVERLSAIIRSSARNGAFNISEEMLSIAGATREQMSKILNSLGYNALNTNKESDVETTAETIFKKNIKRKKYISNKNSLKSKNHKKSKKRHPNLATSKKSNDNRKPLNPNSPFAILSNIKFNTE